MLLGGEWLRTLDFDTGQIGDFPQARLRPGEYVVDLMTPAHTYAVVTTCKYAPLRVLRIGAGGNVSNVALPGPIDTVLADGARAWGVTFPDEQHPNGFLVPLDGGSRVRLPAGFWPDAITDGMVIGTADSPPTVLLVDATTGHVRASLGKGSDLAAGRGLVLWTEGCDVASDEPCTLHRRSVAGGATSSYRLPRSPCCGVLSADGRLLAFNLERAGQDPRYQQGHPLPPSDIAILALDTGRLEVVPGIEMPAKMSPGLAFSADSHWLVITLDAGSRIRVLAWRSGLARPYESRSTVEQVLGPPPVAALPVHPGG